MTRMAVAGLGLLTFILALGVSGIIATLMIGLSLCAAFSIVLLFTLFAPQFCRRSSAFWTLLAGIIVLILWQFVPAVRVLPHVIYAEWLICSIVFFAVYIFDQNPIKITKIV